MKKTVVTTSEAETRTLARRLAAGLKGGDVVCLRGPLGSGKTRFVQGLAAGLGFKGRVTSPTFTLVREYQGKKLRLYHLDLFRVAGRTCGWSGSMITSTTPRASARSSGRKPEGSPFRRAGWT